MSDFDTLHPIFRDLAKKVYEEIQLLSAELGCDCYIASSYRSAEKQLELYSKGRRKMGHRWIKTGGKIVTNALPHQTPHCHTLEDGAPAALAIDVALTDNGAWLKDWDERWAIIPLAIATVNREDLKSGAFFRSLRDYPHIEYRRWKDVR